MQQGRAGHGSLQLGYEHDGGSRLQPLVPGLLLIHLGVPAVGVSPARTTGSISSQMPGQSAARASRILRVPPMPAASGPLSTRPCLPVV